VREIQAGDPIKLTAAATRIAADYHANLQLTYPGSAIPGVLQLVFCDLGTPQSRAQAGLGGDWNVYDELKGLLVARGVPAQTIRYVHEARNDKEKGELFAAARSGRVSVLLGSTEKMGVGTNVQARALALHHLDCPWRPADLAQRDGRILRQGNLNPDVEILRYITEGSFDAYLYQTVERKKRFIDQVMRGRLARGVREIEDISETALSYSEVKALATGDPRIMEKARLDADLTRLERLERSHHRNQRALSATISHAEHDLPALAAERDALDAAITARVPSGGDRFTMTVGTHRYTARADAAIALRDALAAVPPPASASLNPCAWPASLVSTSPPPPAATCNPTSYSNFSACRAAASPSTTRSCAATGRWASSPNSKTAPATSNACGPAWRLRRPAWAPKRNGPAPTTTSPSRMRRPLLRPEPGAPSLQRNSPRATAKPIHPRAHQHRRRPRRPRAPPR
jgi:hypothetical protein